LKLEKAQDQQDDRDEYGNVDGYGECSLSDEFPHEIECGGSGKQVQCPTLFQKNSPKRKRKQNRENSATYRQCPVVNSHSGTNTTEIRQQS